MPEVNVLQIAGLILSVAMSIAGWVIAGHRAKINNLELSINELQKSIANVNLTMVDEYVKDNKLQLILGKIDKTLEKLADIAVSTNQKFESLAVTIAKMEGKGER